MLVVVVVVALVKDLLLTLVEMAVQVEQVVVEVEVAMRLVAAPAVLEVLMAVPLVAEPAAPVE